MILNIDILIDTKIVKLPNKYGDGLGILFNECKQLLYYQQTWGVIDSCEQNTVKCRAFQCSRMSLSSGDTALCSNNPFLDDINNISNYCKVVDQQYHVCADRNGSVNVLKSDNWEFWYKIEPYTDQSK